MRRLGKQRLQQELVWVLRESVSPLTIDQLVHQIFRQRQRVTKPLVLTRTAIRRKLRLKRRVQDLLGAAFIARRWDAGEQLFTLDPNAPLPFVPTAIAPERGWPLVALGIALASLAVAVSGYLVAFVR